MPPNTLYDRLLIPRLENYAENHELDDVDECAAYLRHNYKEYSRQKLGPFKKQVARAVEVLLRRGGARTGPELRLQVLEGQRQRSTQDDSRADDSTTDSGSGSDLRPAVAAEVAAHTGGMNRALSSLYTATDGTSAQAAPPLATAPNGVGAAPSAAQPMEQEGTVAGQAAEPCPGGAPTGDARPGPGKRGGGSAGRAATTKRARTAGGRTSAAPSSVAAPLPVTYADLGGVEAVLDDVRELIEYPLKHPEVYGWLGVEPPRGVLLHGPPGCGKTALANAIANECGVPFVRVSAPEVVSGMSGESEAKIRSLFQEAAAIAPCIIFIDEIDAIAPKRETAQREMERRIVAQLLTCLDDLSSLYPRPPPAQDGTDSAVAGNAPSDQEPALQPGRHVVIIGATNRPDALDPALRRAGRFDREISLGIPSEAARAAILRVLVRRLRLSGDFDFVHLARRTPGFVGADLAALTKEAAALAVKRIFQRLQAEAEAVHAAQQLAAGNQAGNQGGGEDAGSAPAELRPRLGQGVLTPAELEGLSISMADFEEAVSKVQPSVRREGFSTTPDVTWADVGSLGEVREELSFAITRPIAHPELFEAMGLSAATGVLLFGPPGCGKTLVAKAAASESGANFISIKGPELLNKYVGESERAVRQVFARARAAAPCVLFFDEMDALAPRRGSDSTNASAERVVNQLLTEMDGTVGRQGVYVVAATNRPDMIDPALLRPGRLDKILYVPLPPPSGRAAILEALTRKTPLAPDVDLSHVGMSAQLTGFSGADLAALVREACVAALKENMQVAQPALAGGAAPQVRARHFEVAMRSVQPSVSRGDQRMYDKLRLRLRSSRGHLTQQPEDAAQTEGGMGDGAAAGEAITALGRGRGTSDDAQDMEGSAGGPAAGGDPLEDPMEAEL